jgi:DHA2 family multidrug resistance protein
MEASASPAAPAKALGVPPAWRPKHNPWAIALTVTLATFMEVLDTSIANVSLPHIAGNLSVTIDESTWVLTSYLVSNAIVLPISGWIATRIGRKRFYMTCVVIFTASSFCCGMAPSLGWLLFFRIVQGLGGGGLGPSEQSILADTFEPAKRGMAFAMYGMAVVLAPAIGPTLGGFITDNFSWRWVFLINVPVGILSLFLSNRMVEDPPYLAEMKKKSGGIDYVGLVLIAIGLGCLEVVLDKGQEDDWFGSTFIVVFTIIALTALIVFVVWEWGQEHPVVDVKLFKGPSFAAANMMMVALGATLFGSTVLLPQFLQILMHYTAQQSGMALSAGGVAIIMLMPLVGNMISRVDPRRMVAFGFSMLAVSMVFMSHHLDLQIDFATAAKLRIFQSMGLAFLFVPINTLVYVGVPPEKNNAVSGIVNLSRNMGGDIGIAFVTTLLYRRGVFHQNRLASGLPGTGTAALLRLDQLTQRLTAAGTDQVLAARRAMGSMYFSLVQQAQMLAYLDALWVLGVVAALMIPLVFVMKRPPVGARPMGGH